MNKFIVSSIVLAMGMSFPLSIKAQDEIVTEVDTLTIEPEIPLTPLEPTPVLIGEEKEIKPEIKKENRKEKMKKGKQHKYKKGKKHNKEKWKEMKGKRAEKYKNMTEEEKAAWKEKRKDRKGKRGFGKRHHGKKVETPSQIEKVVPTEVIKIEEPQLIEEVAAEVIEAPEGEVGALELEEEVKSSSE